MQNQSSGELLDFSSKRILITGASSGIGRATAKLFAQYGGRLALLDIDTKKLDETLALLEKPENHTLSVLDLSDKDKISGFWQNIKTCPDILINNAGIYPSQEFLDLTDDEYQKIMAINLEATLLMCQHFIRHRRKKGGIIINISSIEAILPFKSDLVPYAISKAGVIVLTRSLARDYGRKGFRINVVLPGAIKTAGTKSQIVNALKEFRVDMVMTAIDFQRRLALNRWGNPEEVAKVILFLASDMASYVQGAMIPVDGGFLSS